MRRRSRASSEPAKARRRKAEVSKRTNALIAKRRVDASVADLQARLERQAHELNEALRQQAATADVLKVISRSTFNLQAVLDTLVESATRLCEAQDGFIFLPDGGVLRATARFGFTPEHHKYIDSNPLKIDRGTVSGRTMIEGRVVHIADVLADPNFARDDVQRIGGFRAALGVPLLREGKVIGVIFLSRAKPLPFTDKQIELVATFADQAVIAIKNVRLFEAEQQRTRELSESLERQTATADVLRIISSSPGGLDPVFKTILENATRICEAKFGILQLYENGAFRIGAMHNAPPEYVEARLREPLLRPGPLTPPAQVVATRQFVHVADYAQHAAYQQRDPGAVRYVELAGVRTLLVMPMLKEGELIGTVHIFRQEVRPFTDKQIELVQNFAAQAVIAIENARLLNELRQRTGDLTESLEQQTGTSEILRVISSSPTDVRPVLDTIVRTAVSLCNSHDAVILLRDGEYLRIAAHYGPMTIDFERLPIRRDFVSGRAVLDRMPVHVHDLTAEGDEFPLGREVALRLNQRTVLGLPLSRKGQAIGCLFLRRTEVLPFSEKQIALLQTFADQAVIAIENVRLFEAEQQRTRELTESLEQQTATSEVLRVISASPGELEPVFQAMLENATRICEAKFGTLFRFDGKNFHPVAQFNTPAALAEALTRRGPFKPTPGSQLDHVMRTKRMSHIADAAADAVISAVPTARLGGARSMVAVPMLKDEVLMGAIVIYRQEVRPFTDKQIALVQNFAAQAVIAIENTRLLNELRQRTDDLSEALEQQTATSEVLKVISSSGGELDPVFNSVLANAVHICGAKFGMLFLWEGEARYRVAALEGAPPRLAEERRPGTIVRAPESTGLGIVASTRQTAHIYDVQAVKDYFDPPPGFNRAGIAVHGGARVELAVPMMKENELVGAIVIYRTEVRPFNDKQIDLVKNFAHQAVIAIENARLLNELRQRTTDLTQSLEQQTATSKVLEVISRSAFDLQAVFETVAESSVRLCGADRAFIWRFDGELLRMVVAFNAPQALKDFISQNPFRPGRQGAAARAALERRTVHIPDVLTDPEYTYGSKDVEAIRTVLGVPILKGDDLLGAMTIYHLEGVRPFTDSQIALVETFADQAAIAIDNVRLLDELRRRTNELGRSVSELQALGEVSQAVNSTLDLETVLSTIVAKAVELSGTEAGAIYGYDEYTREFRLRATHGMDQGLIEVLTQRHIDLADPTIAAIFAHREPTQVADLREEAVSELNGIILLAGYRARMVAPLLRGEDIIGMLVVRRRMPGEFAKNIVDIIKTFAAQSALAIQNARLFREIEDKSRQLEEASQHKSQFLANMSHELRTPLNAILGYTELMADGAYGEPSEKMLGILKRLEANGRHLLGLINDVLDLSKIEAGQLVLELSDYSIQDIAQTVRSTLEPLAADKKLAFKVEVAPKLPSGRGDGRRLTQVLINLVGNAIKFTDAGEIAIKAEAHNGSFHVSVRDTGPGISSADQARLFQEFQQADNAITKKKGGTGLGLAISKRIIEMHGGRIWVESQPGQGSTFTFTLPVTVERQIGTT